MQINICFLIKLFIVFKMINIFAYILLSAYTPFHGMIPTIFLIHDSFHTVLPNVTFLLTTRHLSISSSHTVSKVNPSSAISLVATETTFLPLFFMPLYLLLFSSELLLPIALCEYFHIYIASFTSSFRHHISPSLLLPFTP